MNIAQYLSELPLVATTVAILCFSIVLISLAYMSLRIRKLKGAYQLLEAEYAKTAQAGELTREQLSVACGKLDARDIELQKSLATINELEKRLIAKEIRAEEQLKFFTKERESADILRENLLKEFELLAHKVLESKQVQFDKAAQQQLHSFVTPLREQLLQFNQRVEDGHKHESAQRNQLLGQIIELQKQSQEVSKEAFNLTNALRGSSKAQGMWGELILERILEQSGLVKGREYELQVSQTNEDGKRQQPDAIVHLPDNRKIVIDSKVSLLAYERYINALLPEEAVRERRLLVESIKSHIKSLSGKAYAELFGASSLDFVLMFIPVESAFVFIVESSPELLTEAYQKRIALVSPSSLLVVLKTIETLWRRQNQDENVAKIVANAGKLYDQFVLLSESLSDIGNGILKTEQAYKTFKKRLSEGRGNVIKRVEEIKTLGAATSKSVAQQWLDEADVANLADEEDLRKPSEG